MIGGTYSKVLERLGCAEPTTADDVRAILEDIRVSKGYLDEDYRLDLENLSPEHRDQTLYNNEKQRKLEAAFTKSVSQQIYSSKHRFLYELVQNADDSLYGKARSRLEQPFLRFIITPTTFIAETNEDGFRRANVQAVCATGESSKKASPADVHIGEKGFGFKSVFSVAEEVHIQSGLWSFRFQHRQGDDGLGMVTPLSADAIRLPTDVTTRITLRLTESAIADYQGLLNAVASMPESTIFFLQRLQRLHIHVADLDAKVIATTFEKTVVDTSMNRVRLKRYQEVDGRTIVDKSLYRCFTHVVENMPEHEYRKGQKSARIDLAFPVEPKTKRPKLSKSGQHVFAYLPLLRLQQIQFIIQSDFVTLANREGVSDCAWNTSIFEGVAKTFAMAVESFTKDDDTLRYSWLEYLPIKLNDDRWKILCPLIIKELARRPILRTRRRRLKKPGELLLLPSHMLYDSEPILEDLPDDVYLASDYEPYKSKVESLGVRRANLSSMIKRLEVDILHPQKSRVKTKDPDDPWHVAFALMFLRAWKNTQPAVPVQERLKSLAIIPLQSRLQWTSAPGQIGGGGLKNVYFSETDGISVPNSIDLRLLDTQASTNLTRKAFYELLDVKECPHKLVVEKIKQMHLSTDRLLDVESHLQYLFYANEDPESVNLWIWVPTNRGTYVRESSKLYFPSDDKDDLHQLLDGIHSSKFSGIVEFLDESLVELETESPKEGGLIWQSWLQQATGARYNPPLLHWNTDKSSFELSPVLKVLHKHKPKRLLRTLRAHWDDYEEDALEIEADLRAMQVRCMVAADESRRRAALENTYLPTANVVDRALELGLSLSKFDILDLPELRKATNKLDDAGYRRWRFLEDFGVRRQPDLDFYKRALRSIALESQDPDMEVLKEIYASIAKCTTVDAHTDLCEFFKEKLLWIPDSESWEDRRSCNWCGPAFLQYRSVLYPHYGHDQVLSEFFRKILDVTDTSISDVMFELECCYEVEEPTSLAVAGEIYEWLSNNASTDEEWKSLIKFFHEGDHILGTNDIWHTIKKCVWQTPFLLSGYHELSSTYPQLESFFVKRLKVKKVTPSMLIDEIPKMFKKKSPDYNSIRARLIDVGMILARTELDKAAKKSLEDLAEGDCLPKQGANGETTFLAIHGHYAIADHARYGNAFAEQEILLDFSVEEVQIMNVMFEHMGVKQRYLSSLVVEESTVEDGAEEDNHLTHQLQTKAYALYCCAAKYKSVKALRGDCTLFESLSAARVLKGDLATHLVIDKKDLGLQFKVRSDRSFIHHEVAEGCLKLYVPEDRKQRRTCYRSQLPRLLAEIMAIDSSACHDISVIIDSNLRALEDVLVEHDITPVSWIEQPVLDMSDDENSVTSSPRLQYILNAANPEMQRRGSISSSSTGSTSPSESNVVDYATSSSMQMTSKFQVNRSSNQADHDRHHGALGEAFVFETLSALNLRDFTRNNWRSTIRGELSRYPKYADITDWKGRETADIVYKDCDGRLTRWLKKTCTGGYPAGPSDRDFVEQPIEYYFEVKSTTGACRSRFFLSTGQYKLMRDMTVQTDQLPNRIYVIVRVFDVLSDDKKLKMFVDPVRLEGTCVEFEAEGWTGRAL